MDPGNTCWDDNLADGRQIGLMANLDLSGLAITLK
jgi:hypothetical protein